MQTERSPWLIAFALGTAAIFDVTGAAIYRVLRASLPSAPGPPAAGAFQQAAEELTDARREAVSRARDKGGVTLST